MKRTLPWMAKEQQNPAEIDVFTISYMGQGPQLCDTGQCMHWHQQQVHARSTKPLPGQNWHQNSTLSADTTIKSNPTKQAQGGTDRRRYLGKQQVGRSSWATQTDVPGQTRSAIKNERTHVKIIRCTVQLVCARHAHEVCGVKHLVQASFLHSTQTSPRTGACSQVR